VEGGKGEKNEWKCLGPKRKNPNYLQKREKKEERSLEKTKKELLFCPAREKGSARKVT